MNALRSLFKRQDGATAIEYALLAGLIALAIITAVTAIGTNLAPVFTTVAAKAN